MTLKEKYIRTLYHEKALMIREEPFTLHHAGTSHIFISHHKFLEDYKNMKILIDNYIDLIPKELKNYQICSVDSVMSPVLGALIAFHQKKDLIVKKAKKVSYGLQSELYGKPGKEAIIVDDVTSSGTMIADAAKALRAKKTRVHYAIVSACRSLSVVKKLKKLGIKLLYIATYEEVIETLWPLLTSKEKGIVAMEIKERKLSWKFS